jgi:radical SAM protein with 4Fe4S-binding SPASM domain
MEDTRAISENGGIIYVVWEITLRCDQACKHCGSRAGKARHDELRTSEALEVVDQLHELGVKEISLIGGEAYLHSGWLDIAKRIADYGMLCTMTTGGRGLTKERAKGAAEAGIYGVSISIDGCEETHDLQRGLKGSYRSALQALQEARQAGLVFTVNTQVNRKSFPDLDHVLAMLIEQGARSWQVQFTVPMGRAADHPDWLLQPYDLLHVMPKLADLADRATEHGIRFWAGNNLGYFGPYEERLMQGTQAGAQPAGCRAGWNVLGLEANGAVKGCPSLPTKTWTGGNVRTQKIADICEQSPELRYTRDRTVEDLWGYCRTCYYADVCRAGCTWTAQVIMGKPGNNPYCHHRALEFQQQGLRERLVQHTPAPGEPFDHGVFEIIVEPLNSPEVVEQSSENTAGKFHRHLPLVSLAWLRNYFYLVLCNSPIAT